MSELKDFTVARGRRKAELSSAVATAAIAIAALLIAFGASEAVRRIERIAGPQRSFAVVSHPTRVEFLYGRNTDQHQEMLDALRAAGHPPIDVLPRLLATVPAGERTALYWPRDQHFKPDGYRLFAEAVQAELAARMGAGNRPAPP